MENAHDKRTFENEKNETVIRPDHAPIITRPSAYGIGVIDGKILFARCAYTNLLDLPGGAIEEGESVDECIEREGLEETGYRLRRVSREPVAVLERQFYWSVDDQYFMAILLIYPVEVIALPEPGWKPMDENEISGVTLAWPKHLLKRDVTPCYIEPVSRYMASQGLPGLF